MPSRYKRAHRTHALAQPAGEPYPHLDIGQAAGRKRGDLHVLALFADLRARVPNAAERAKLLGVSSETEAAWSRGTAVPILRAQRKKLERALRDLARG